MVIIIDSLQFKVLSKFGIGGCAKHYVLHGDRGIVSIICQETILLSPFPPSADNISTHPREARRALHIHYYTRVQKYQNHLTNNLPMYELFLN